MYKEDSLNIMLRLLLLIGSMDVGGLFVNEFVIRFFWMFRLVVFVVVNNVGRVVNNVRSIIDKIFMLD